MATYTLTGLPFTVDVPIGPAYLHDVQGEAEVIVTDGEAGFEPVAIALDTLKAPPGQKYGKRYVPVEIGRYRCDYSGKIDAATPDAEWFTRRVADALLKDDVFARAVDDALAEARDGERDQAAYDRHQFHNAAE